RLYVGRRGGVRRETKTKTETQNRSPHSPTRHRALLFLSDWGLRNWTQAQPMAPHDPQVLHTNWHSCPGPQMTDLEQLEQLVDDATPLVFVETTDSSRL